MVAAPCQLGVVVVLPGQHDELVLARGEVGVHGIARRRERAQRPAVGIGQSGDIVSIGVEHIDVYRTHMVAEHIGALQVVVVPET